MGLAGKVSQSDCDLETQLETLRAALMRSSRFENAYLIERLNLHHDSRNALSHEPYLLSTYSDSNSYDWHHNYTSK